MPREIDGSRKLYTQTMSKLLECTGKNEFISKRLEVTCKIETCLDCRESAGRHTPSCLIHAVAIKLYSHFLMKALWDHLRQPLKDTGLPDVRRHLLLLFSACALLL